MTKAVSDQISPASNMHVESGCLPDGFSSASARLVKQNAKRSVYALETKNAEHFYLKIDRPAGFIDSIRNIFRSNSRAEYESAQILAKAGIPCPEHMALLRRGTHSAILTRELSHFVRSDVFWHTIALSEHEKQEIFLRNLYDLCLKMFSSGIAHPDFHAGNLMVNEYDCRLALIDLHGIKQKSKNNDPLKIFHIFSDFADRIDLAEYIPEYADAITHKAHENILKQWPKREKQILSGNSKFCRTNDEGLVIRNTPYYTFQELPNRIEAFSMPHEKARRLWLDSFKYELMRMKDTTSPPLAWKIAKDSKKTDTLYYAAKH